MKIKGRRKEKMMKSEKN